MTARRRGWHHLSFISSCLGARSELGIRAGGDSHANELDRVFEQIASDAPMYDREM